MCKLDIALNDNDVAYLSAGKADSSSAHAILKLKEGDKVWLKLIESGPVAGGWRTAFSGMLVQPDIS
jgi:hypothetical protein